MVKIQKARLKIITARNPQINAMRPRQHRTIRQDTNKPTMSAPTDMKIHNIVIHSRRLTDIRPNRGLAQAGEVILPILVHFVKIKWVAMRRLMPGLA